jgi:hypothetical protein
VLAIAVLKEFWYIQVTTSLLCSKKLIRIRRKLDKLAVLIYFYIKVFNKAKYSKENGIIKPTNRIENIVVLGK